MSWKSTAAQLDRLRLKHGHAAYANPFPNLGGDTRRDGGFAPIAYPNRQPIFVKSATVSHLHKSSYQVLLPSEVKFAGRKV